MQSTAFLFFTAFLPSSLPASCCQTLFLCSHCCRSELLISYSFHVDNNFQGLWSQHALNKILELECCFGLLRFLEATLSFLFFVFLFSVDKKILVQSLQFQAQVRKVQYLVPECKQVMVLGSGKGWSCCAQSCACWAISHPFFVFYVLATLREMLLTPWWKRLIAVLYWWQLWHEGLGAPRSSI